MTARIEKHDQPSLDELTQAVRGALTGMAEQTQGLGPRPTMQERIDRVAAENAGRSVDEITAALIAADVHPDEDFCRPIAQVIAARQASG